MSVFDDVFGKPRSEENDTAADDSQFRERYPVLAVMLFDTPVLGKKRRAPATLTIVCEDGVVKAGLRDRDREMSLWVSSETVGGVFAALEEALGERPVRWKKSTWKGR